MIGILGKDGEGYRWLIPRPAEVRKGTLRVMPFAPRQRVVRVALLNTVLLLLVAACHHDARHGLVHAWYAPFYLGAFCVLLLQLLLRIRRLMRPITIRVTVPLDLRSVPPLYWGDQVQFLSTFSVVLGVCIGADHPHPLLPWDALCALSALLCVTVALLPWFNRRFLLERRG